MPIREYHEEIRISIECSDRELPKGGIQGQVPSFLVRWSGLRLDEDQERVSPCRSVTSTSASAPRVPNLGLIPIRNPTAG